jgi:hypothetical protein
MRNIVIISVIFFVFSSCTLIDKRNEVKELTLKVDSLSSKVDRLSEQNKMMEEEFTWIENEFVELNKLKKAPIEKSSAAPTVKVVEKPVTDWQCMAITNSGARCSRPVVKDSKYCWQHKKTYEPDKPEKKETPAASGSAVPKK